MSLNRCNPRLDTSRHLQGQGQQAGSENPIDSESTEAVREMGGADHARKSLVTRCVVDTMIVWRGMSWVE